MSAGLKGFEKKSEELFQFRCPLCGDSRSSEKKKRGYLYLRDGQFFFSCHNCQANHRFDTFLRMINPFLYKEYKLDKFGGKRAGERTTPVKLSSAKPVFNKQPKQTKLPAHIFRYLKERCLPADKFDYTEHFFRYINKLSPGSFDMKKMGKYDHPRLLIPLLDERGSMTGIQGRALNGELPKYYTIALTDDGKGVYGINGLDQSATIYVVEGSTDAMMIDNAVAVLDANYSRAARLFDPDLLVIIPDSDTRNRDIMKSVNKCVKAGLAVCLLPPDRVGNDLNEMAVGGMSKQAIKDLVDKYTYTGARLSLEFKKWRKD